MPDSDGRLGRLLAVGTSSVKGVEEASSAPSAPRRQADAALELVPVDPQRARQEGEAALRAADQIGDLVAAAQAERALGMAARTHTAP